MHFRLLLLAAVLLPAAIAAAPRTAPAPPIRLASTNNQPTQSFQDPHGRYTLTLPSGWEASASGDDTVFRNGSSWAQARLLKADSPSAAVDLAVTLFRSQFVSFSTINRGDTTIAGRPSHGLNVDATNPAGQHISVLFTAQPDGKRQFFVLVSATPMAQAAQLNTGVMTLAGSVHFNGE